jgi:hypothetical protein
MVNTIQTFSFTIVQLKVGITIGYVRLIHHTRHSLIDEGVRFLMTSDANMTECLYAFILGVNTSVIHPSYIEGVYVERYNQRLINGYD